jgi:hypothetical protein
MSIKEYLNQAYRGPSSKKWKRSFAWFTGLFVFIFLFVFKPSPYIYNQKPLFQLLISLGFGIIVSLILFIFKFVIEPRIITPKWTLGRSISWGIFISACIGIASYFYIVLLFENDFQVQYLHIYIKYFFLSVFSAILIGSIPISINHLINYNRKYKNALKKAGVLEDEQAFWEDLVKIQAGLETNNFTFDPRKIIYISSDDNYVSVFYFEGESVKKVLIRGTLKAVEKDLKRNYQFIRCHRSYIVNMLYFKRIIGHSQNQKLVFRRLNIQIPVSRSKSAHISKRISDPNS